MKIILLSIHILISIALIGLILLQSSHGGLGNAFGGGEFYRCKRGAEKVVFTSTVIIACLFLITSILNILVR